MSNRWYLPLLLLFSVIVLFLFIGGVLRTTSLRLTFESSQELNEGWMHVSNDDKTTTLDTLPIRLNIDNRQSYSIETTLGQDFNQPQKLLIRTSLSNLLVTLDGDVVYEVNFEEGISYASTWHIVPIPDQSEGRALRLTFDTPYEGMRGIINEVEYGTTNALYVSIFSDYGFRFVMGILALIVGMLIFLTSYFILKNENRYNVYLGFFVMLVSVWLLSESRMLQFFISNANVIKSLSYIALAFLPVPMALYIKHVLIRDHQRWFDGITVLFIIHTIILTMLHFTQTISFFQSVVSTIILLLVSIVLTAYLFMKEFLYYRHKTALRALMLIFAMGIFIGFEVMFFSLSDFNRTADFAAIAFSLLLLLVFMSFIRFILINYRGNLEKNLYAEIATSDQLTNAYSRYAFFHELNMYETEESKKNVSLIYFDLDGLKIINDQFGHAVGDKAIIKAYEIIDQVFGVYGNIYRMGGDEFVCITENLNQTIFDDRYRLFRDLNYAIERDTPYSFNISVGLAQFDVLQDQNLMDTLKRSDHFMYKNKAEGKRISSLMKKG